MSSCEVTHNAHHACKTNASKNVRYKLNAKPPALAINKKRASDRSAGCRSLRSAPTARKKYPSTPMSATGIPQMDEYAPLLTTSQFTVSLSVQNEPETNPELCKSEYREIPSPSREKNRIDFASDAEGISRRPQEVHIRFFPTTP